MNNMCNNGTADLILIISVVSITLLFLLAIRMIVIQKSERKGKSGLNLLKPKGYDKRNNRG